MNTMMYGAEAAEATNSKAIVPAERQQHTTLMEVAVKSGNVELFRETMRAQKEWDEYQAKKQFSAALTRAKAIIPIIKKTELVEFTSERTQKVTRYYYADLANVVETITPILAAEGLNVRHRVSNEYVGEKCFVTVVCLLEGYGHAEADCKLTAPADFSGLKSPAQAIRHTQTQLERYTLMAALGLAAAEDEEGHYTERGNSNQNKPPSVRAKDEIVVEATQEQRDEREPHEVTVGRGEGAKGWVAKYIAAINTAKDGNALAQWATVNTEHLALLTTKYPDLRSQVDLVFNSLLSGFKATTRKPPSVKKGQPENVDSAQWRKDMIGALGGYTTEDELKAARKHIGEAPDGTAKSDLDAVEAEMKAAEERIKRGE